MKLPLLWMLLLTLFLLLVTWEGFADCCQRLKICNPCNRWCPRVSGILWRQTSMVLFPSSIVVQALCFSLKVKSLENQSCRFAEIIIVKEMLTNHLFHTLHPASYCACCELSLEKVGQGPAPLLKAPAQDARRAALAARPLVSGRIFGQNSGAQGCEGTPQEVRRGHWGRSTPSPPWSLQASISCGRSCPLALQGCCCGRDAVQARLAVGCLWNGANRNWNFPPTRFFSYFSFLPSLKFPSWFFSVGRVWSQQWNALFCSLKFVPGFSVTSMLCLWETIRHYEDCTNSTLKYL